MRQVRILFLLAIPALLSAQINVGRVLPANRSIRVLAFGDFGSGNPSQVKAAAAMRKRHSQTSYDLGITLGDNFYRCGVRSITDPKWKTRWEDLYTPLGIPFFATLGNHDYGHPVGICPAFRGSPDAEIAYTNHSVSWRMPSRYYSFTAGPVRFFAIDTEGWSPAQQKWLEQELAASADDPDVRWRVVYGHHPIFSSGKHANERRIGALRRAFTPLFKKYNVLYVAGHDHGLERLNLDGLDLLISGGAGAQLRFMTHPKPESKFSAVMNGFLELIFDKDKFEARFYDTDLKSLDEPPLRREFTATRSTSN